MNTQAGSTDDGNTAGYSSTGHEGAQESPAETDSPVGTHRSPGLAVLGLLALLVAGWGLADGPQLPDVATLGWIVVGVGLVIGIGLVAFGARASRN